MTTACDTYEFQAEAKALLRLVIHSLYTSKDIFLRELISNASDAIDRVRFESLSNRDLIKADERFAIRLELDRANRTLSVSDNGIGMTRAEVIANIGTIARSATRELRALAERASGDELTQLIGEFGVGFYSACMVADKVTVLTRRAGEQGATLWESDGSGTFSVRDAEKPEWGTSVTVHLKPPDPERGIEDYTQEWRLVNIVKRHSDFVRYPIVIANPPGEPGEAAPSADGAEHGERVLNAMKPIWKRAPADVTAEEHAEFYREIAQDWSEPLKWIHLRAEGTFEYDALLYVPAKASYDLYYVAPKAGLRLLANCVVVLEECQELLPTYLRFVRGVVDVAGLPLNVSRQRLQQDHHVSLIRKKLTRKIFDTFQQLRQSEPETYLKFWREFGRAMKEGVSSDYDNRDTILGLALFQSSRGADELVSLDDYVGRMPPGQEEIFYLTGESRSVLEHSPHLEAIAARGYEVLFMTDPVDELLLQHVSEHKGKKLKSAAKGALALGSAEEKQRAAADLEERQKEYAPLVAFLQTTLDADVKQVRLSNRLKQSPACLVVEDHDHSPMLERLLQKGQSGGPRQRRTLELNPEHPLVAQLQRRFSEQPGDDRLRDAAHVLFGLALLLEGSDISDRVAFSRSSLELLGHAI